MGTLETERAPWRAIEAIAVFVLSFIVAVVVLLGVALFVKDKDLLTVIGIGAQELALLIGVLVWVRVRYQAGPDALGLRALTASNVGRGALIGIGGIAASIVVGAIVTSIVQAFSNHPVTRPDQIPLDHPAHAATLAIIGVSVILLAPLAEETFFRGMVYRGLRRWASIWPAVILSAAIFAVSHILPLVMLPIFVLGIGLAWAAERWGSIVPGIVAHMVFNTFGFFIIVFNR